MVARNYLVRSKQWTRFCGSIFLGGWFPQNLDYFRISQAEEEGSGEESSACSIRFLLAKFGADKKYRNSILCLFHSTIFRPQSKGVHPRHSPRTFPLGLLAPRCLGFLLILAIPALRSGGEGRRLFGGRKESFPQRRLVSAGLDQPAQPTPFLVFISALCGVAFATRFRIARLRRRSSFSPGRPSGNA